MRVKIRLKAKKPNATKKEPNRKNKDQISIIKKKLIFFKIISRHYLGIPSLLVEVEVFSIFLPSLFVPHLLFEYAFGQR